MLNVLISIFIESIYSNYSRVKNKHLSR